MLGRAACLLRSAEGNIETRQKSHSYMPDGFEPVQHPQQKTKETNHEQSIYRCHRIWAASRGTAIPVRCGITRAV